MQNSRPITRTQWVFRHGYLSPAGDTTGTRSAWVPTGEYGYHYHNLWYPWYLLVQVQSHLPTASVECPYAIGLGLYIYIYIYLGYKKRRGNLTLKGIRASGSRKRLS